MAAVVFNSWAFVWTFIAFLLILAGTSIDNWTSTNKLYNDLFISKNETIPIGTYLFRGATIYGTIAADYKFEGGYDYAEVCPPDNNKVVDDTNNTKHNNNNNKNNNNNNNKNNNNGQHRHKEQHAKIIGQRARNLNEISAGMVALLLLTNVVCFVASFRTVLGCTRSSIGGNLASARVWSVFAFITTVVTWALWLRAHQNYLNKKHNGCRFTAFPRIDVTLGASFGLFIVGTFLYLVVMVHVSRVVRMNTQAANGTVTAAPMSHRWLVFFALAAFAAIFTASIDNVWSRASSRTFEQNLETQINNYIGAYDYVVREYENLTSQYTDYDIVNNNFDYFDNSDHFNSDVWARYQYLETHGDAHVNANETTKNTHNGVSIVDYEEEFGVYTAIQVLQISLTYSDDSNRQIICPRGVPIDQDGANFAVVQGGRVTLGFAITATILAFFAAWLQMGDNRSGFWLSTAALCCCAVSLIVWAVTADYIIRDRCCFDQQVCTLSQSYGLIAAGAAFLVVAMFYQAWVLTADIYVLPAHAYGMANELETELQTV